MDTRRQFGLILLALFAAFGAVTAQAQVDQSALARQLLAGNVRERDDALETARALAPQQIGSELRAALIQVLERGNHVRELQYEAGRRGETLAAADDAEFVVHVSWVVAALGDPRAIPALIGALGTGALPTRALVNFGEQAAPALLAAVRTPTTMHYIVDEALIALRFLVEGKGPQPLVAGTLSDIRLAAKLRLTGKQYFTTLWHAIDLAIALKDPELRQIVQSLASDREEVLARGIKESEVPETQRRAAQRLAGVPAEPVEP